MVARITRLLILLQCAFGLGVFFAAVKLLQIQNYWLAAGLAVGVVLLGRLSITANSFLLAWLYRSETPSQFQIDWRQASRLFRSEFNATMISSSWSMAFRSFEKRLSSTPRGLPVLLIHGYGCNSGYWHWMSKRLGKAHITHHAVNLEPVLTDIDNYVATISRAVDTLAAETGSAQVIIVAHSMGGLASRAYLRDHGDRHIAKVITLGTPHGGTGLANHGAGENSRQMRREPANGGSPSAWLRALEASESAAIRHLFVSIYSHHDNIVAPQISSHLAGATNIQIQGVGHVAMALNNDVQELVIEHILSTTGRQTPTTFAEA